jgi:hypothetical protein
MQFKKGDLVLYKYPNHELRGVIGIVLRDTDVYRTKVHFANAAIKPNTRYVLSDALTHAPK